MGIGISLIGNGKPPKGINRNYHIALGCEPIHLSCLRPRSILSAQDGFSATLPPTVAGACRGQKATNGVGEEWVTILPELGMPKAPTSFDSVFLALHMAEGEHLP